MIMVLGPSIVTKLVVKPAMIKSYDRIWLYIVYRTFEFIITWYFFPLNCNHACKFRGATDNYQVCEGMHSSGKLHSGVRRPDDVANTEPFVAQYIMLLNTMRERSRAKTPIIFLHMPHITQQIIIGCEATRSPVKLYSGRRGLDRAWHYSYDDLVYFLQLKVTTERPYWYI